MDPTRRSDFGASENDRTTPDYTPVHEYVFKLQKPLDSLYTESARLLLAAPAAEESWQRSFAQLDAEQSE
ncbi:MAG UNVERIFIED_CONTAM: hypothetical protein LVR29_23865 [Microcystis novacekii LVE1205-3]